MKHLEGRNVTVDSVPAALSLYTRLGFTVHTWAMHLYSGKIDHFLRAAADFEPLTSVTIEQVQDAACLTDYDAAIYPIDLCRRKLWQYYIDNGMELVMAKTADGQVVGFAGCVQRIGSKYCNTCYKIGPLYADNTAIARELCKVLLGGKKSMQFCSVYTPEPNIEANDFSCKILGLEFRECTNRLYTDHEEQISMARVYGAVNFDIFQV